jgi:pimeloyl-ACP methyl ester carboxylesterase
MAVFDSDGVKIHYEVFGDGPSIMLVHGFASSLQDNWVLTGWVKRLESAGRRVVALDCRGHGESDKPHDPEAYAGGMMAGDVVRLMDHLGIDRADLMGYSMGGGIALDLLMRHPQRLGRVVLGGVGGATRRPADSSAIADALAADDPSAVSSAVARGFREFAQQRGNDLKALAACIRRGRSRPDPEALAGIKVPVLVVVGEKDDLVGRADTLADAIPGARLVTVPDRDHLTVVPDGRYKEAVFSFLGEEAVE